jgi:hypothetical protein
LVQLDIQEDLWSDVDAAQKFQIPFDEEEGEKNPDRGSSAPEEEEARKGPMPMW